MAYSANDPDPYLDQNGVLKNLLGITDSKQLDEAEADITFVASSTLSEEQVSGSFDLAHLQGIHKHLFDSIYAWAGQLRTVEIDKGTTKFANSEFLASAADKIFRSLKGEELLTDLSDTDYLDKFTHYYSEINILHPFREGNGRAQRAFFSLLAAQSGRRVAWEDLDPAENLQASIAAYDGDESQLRSMLERLVKKQK